MNIDQEYPTENIFKLKQRIWSNFKSENLTFNSNNCITSVRLIIYKLYVNWWVTVVFFCLLFEKKSQLFNVAMSSNVVGIIYEIMRSQLKYAFHCVSVKFMNSIARLRLFEPIISEKLNKNKHFEAFDIAKSESDIIITINLWK